MSRDGRVTMSCYRLVKTMWIILCHLICLPTFLTLSSSIYYIYPSLIRVNFSNLIPPLPLYITRKTRRSSNIRILPNEETVEENGTQAHRNSSCKEEAMQNHLLIEERELPRSMPEGALSGVRGRREEAVRGSDFVLEPPFVSRAAALGWGGVWVWSPYRRAHDPMHTGLFPFSYSIVEFFFFLIILFFFFGRN